MIDNTDWEGVKRKSYIEEAIFNMVYKNKNDINRHFDSGSSCINHIYPPLFSAVYVSPVAVEWDIIEKYFKSIKFSYSDIGKNIRHTDDEYEYHVEIKLNKKQNKSYTTRLADPIDQSEKITAEMRDLVEKTDECERGSRL